MSSIYKGEQDVAIGNGIGSNRRNLLSVIGLAGAIALIGSLALQRGFAAITDLTSPSR